MELSRVPFRCVSRECSGSLVPELTSARGTLTMVRKGDVAPMVDGWVPV